MSRYGICKSEFINRENECFEDCLKCKFWEETDENYKSLEDKNV